MSWRTVSLGEVANVGAGNSAPQEDRLFENGTHNFYRTSDVGRIRTGVISESSDKLNSEGIRGLKLHSIGTILFPKSGASTFLNHRVMLGKEGYVSSHLATIKAKADVANDKFLLYFLSTIDAKNLVQDSNYPSLKTSVIEKIIFSLPSLSTQQKIVTKLDAIFAEIDKATAAAEANAKNAEALFQSYLTQVFENGGEGWTETTLEKVCKITNGSTPKRDKREFWENGDICWFTVDDIRKSGRVLSETIQHVTKAALDYTSLKVLPADSVLICCTASVGEYAIIKKPMATNQQFNGLTVIDNNLLPDFLFWYAASMKPLLLSVSGKVTIDFIPISRLKSLPIKFPKVDQQLILVDKLNHISNNSGISKQAFESKVVELKKLKQSILKQAFAGELVKE